MPVEPEDNIINAKELRDTLKQVVESVRRGYRYTVLYRSRPAFRIVPIDDVPGAAEDDLAEDPLYGSGALGESGDGDLAARHDEILYGS